jgi:hypothetical protein
MNTLVKTSDINAVPQTGLKDLVDELVKKSLPLAVRNQSLIVNNIPEKFIVSADENVIIKVVNGLLDAVINNARNSCIFVSAKMIYENMVEVFVKDNNSYHTYAIACGLQEVAPEAEKMGGRLHIMNQRQKVTTISFTFPVVPAKKIA